MQDIVLVEGNNELNVAMTPLVVAGPYLMDVYVLPDRVASGDEFGVSGRIFLPAKPYSAVAWRLTFWYWERRASGTKDFGYFEPLPEDVYDFGIAMPTERWIQWRKVFVVPPGTYTIYSSCYLWLRPNGDVMEPIWEDVDTGLRITVV